MLICCSIRDSAVSAFMRPFYVPAKGSAMRAFSDEVNNPQGEMFRHPEDYELYELGKFDEQTGMHVDMLPQPELITRGKDVYIRPGEESPRPSRKTKVA